MPYYCRHIPFFLLVLRSVEREFYLRKTRRNTADGGNYKAVCDRLRICAKSKLTVLVVRVPLCELQFCKSIVCRRVSKSIEEYRRVSSWQGEGSRQLQVSQDRPHVTQTLRARSALRWYRSTGYGTDSQGLRGINGVTGPLMIH